METIIGTIMSILWVAYVTIGFMSQIRKNHHTKSFGWSTPLFALALLTYVFGATYAIVTRDVFIGIPYVLGLIGLAYMLYQFFWFRQHHKL